MYAETITTTSYCKSEIRNKVKHFLLIALSVFNPWIMWVVLAVDSSNPPRDNRPLPTIQQVMVSKESCADTQSSTERVCTALVVEPCVLLDGSQPDWCNDSANARNAWGYQRTTTPYVHRFRWVRTSTVRSNTTLFSLGVPLPQSSSVGGTGHSYW
jgi:hypothetical protein